MNRLFTRIAQQVGVGALNAQLAQHPELWDANPLRRLIPNSPHAGMQDIWVRYNDVVPYLAKGDLSGFNDLHVPVWYPAWRVLPALHPLVFGLMSQVYGEMLGGILITRIPHGQGIAPHVDQSWHVDYFDKFYLSLEAGPGAVFHAEGESICPEVGDIWRFDNRVRHWVTNDSGHDRVTLIICIRTDFYRAPWEAELCPGV